MLLARLVIYPVLFLLAFIGMQPGAVFLGMLALIVPGLILVAAPTVALYAPFIDLLVTGLLTRRPLLWLPGLFALALIATALPFGASRALDAEISAATAGDFQRDTGEAPRRLLLTAYRRTQGGADGAYAGRWISSSPDGDGCDETCARLLLSRQVEAIIRPTGRGLTGPPSLDNGYAGEATVYTYEPAATCPTTERRMLEVKPATLALIGAGNCIVARAVAAPAFDTAVTELRDSFALVRMDAVSPGVTEIATRTLWRCSAGRCAATAVQTSAGGRRLAAPLAIGFENHADMNMRRAFRRTSMTVHPGTRDDWMLGIFHLAGASLPTMDPERLRASAEAALAAAAAARRPLSDAEQEVVGRTLGAIADRAGAPTPDDLALLRSIILHPTADWLPGFSEVFREHPDAGVRLADTLIDGFARSARSPKPERQRNLRRGIARVLADLPPDSFAAHGPAILRAAALPGAVEGAETLLPRLGDLGPSAVPVLTRALAEPGDVEAAAYGLCRVGSPAVGAAPALVALQASGAHWDRDRTRVIAVALARMGRPDLIRRPPPEAYARTNAIAKRYDDAWFAAVPPTITASSPPDVCSRETLRNGEVRRPPRPESR
jgi:hypothetical protein